MLEQTLYDKVISVTLYRNHKTVQSLHRTISPRTYNETTVNGRKVLRNAAAFVEEVRTYDPKQTRAPTGNEGTSYRQTGLIEFYQGNYRDVFVDVVLSHGQYVEKYKRVRAHGSVYTYRTLEDMKKGVRPDGNPFKTGDRALILEDKSTWNVYVDGSVDGLYEEEDIEIPSQVLEIKCTDSGLKPDMTLSINLLPGQNCYGATLKIRNFNLDAIDIRAWDKMVITAGYRTGKKVVYNCPIFSSYIESPNPDGVTVFEGLTVGVAEDVLTDRYLIIDFRQERMIMEDFIRDVAAGISEDIDVEIALDDEYAKAVLSITKQKVYAQNGMAVLNWLQEFISQAIYNMSGGQTTVMTQLVDGKLIVIAINGKNKTPKIYENVVNLDMVTGATFVGTALTVVAPWNPALKPGDLFFMPPSFINGAKLPNSINVPDYRNKDNLYRAITISVEFASTDSTNKMTVLAVPAQWSGRLPNSKTTEMPADKYGELVTEMYQRAQDEVHVGKLASSEVSAMRKASQETKTGNTFFDEHDTILAQWPTWIAITQSETTGNCISKIAEYYLTIMEGGPKLTDGMGNNRQSHYNETKQWFYDQNRQKALNYYQDSGIWSNMLWWPFMVLGTYYRRQQDLKAGVDNNWAETDPNNPNYLKAKGVAVYVPVFPNGSWESNRGLFERFRDVWKDAYTTYKNNPVVKADLGSSIKVWRAMYYYMGGAEDLP